MRLILFFIVISNSVVLAQHVSITPDSSKLLFPNHVAVSLKPTLDGKRFAIEGSALRVVLVQCNYLYNRIDLSSQNVELYKRERVYQDSVIRVLKKDLAISDERVQVYKEAYAQSKLVSLDYDKQTISMLAEHSRFQKQSRKSKRRSFYKGLAFGLGSGVAATILMLQHD
jgi:hypothetical protein